MRKQKMRRKHWKLVAVITLLAVMLSAAVYARKGREKGKQSSLAEVERKVTEAQVPAAALATLKKLAAGAEITEFAEEIEHGHTFYEGSWQAPSTGQTDVLVTPTGDLVEIEVQVAAKQVPAAVRKAARKAAGKGTRLAFEKKTMVLYEVKFSKADRRHELLLAPDGHRVEEEVEKVKRHEDDDEDDVSIDEVSKAVKVTILKHAAGGEIEEIECEDEDRRGIYEVGVIVDGKKMELKVGADGELVSKEIEEDDDEDDDDEHHDDDEDDDDEDDDDKDQTEGK
jgi:hypothetical protein